MARFLNRNRGVTNLKRDIYDIVLTEPAPNAPNIFQNLFLESKYVEVLFGIFWDFLTFFQKF